MLDIHHGCRNFWFCCLFFLCCVYFWCLRCCVSFFKLLVWWTGDKISRLLRDFGWSFRSFSNSPNLPACCTPFSVLWASADSVHRANTAVLRNWFRRFSSGILGIKTYAVSSSSLCCYPGTIFDYVWLCGISPAPQLKRKNQWAHPPKVRALSLIDSRLFAVHNLLRLPP